MLDSNYINSLMNPKAIGESQEDAEHFRVTNTNFANAQVSSTQRELVAQDSDYEHCPNCNRKFFAGRLHLHLKSCKDGKPLKPIKGKTHPAKISSPTQELMKDHYQNQVNNTYRTKIEENEECDPSFGLNGGIGNQETSSPVSHAKSSQRDSRRRQSYKDETMKSTNQNSFAQKNRYKQDESISDEPSNSRNNVDQNEAEVPDDVERQKVEDGRVGCTICNRFFHQDRILQHEKACAKSNKKRPVFNATKQRAVPEQQEFIKKPAETSKSKKPPIKVNKALPKVEKAETSINDQKEEAQSDKKVPRWKAEHDNFIKNLQFNRKLKTMEARGEDTSHLVAPTIVNDSYVDCPHCLRKFAPATAERHIPKCKNTFNRPKPPKNIKLEKIEEVQKLSRTKTQVTPKKNGENSIESLDKESKSATKQSIITQENAYLNSNEKFKKNTNHRNSQSRFSTGNHDNQLDDILPERSSPTETPKSRQYNTQAGNKFILKKTNSFETSNKQAALPSIRKPEALDNVTPEPDVKNSTKKGRDFRSQSPSNHLNREEKKVFMEPMPKKDDLLRNYQGVLGRTSTYSTETCPYCSRNFALHAAERHIPVCKNSQTRVLKKSYDSEDPAEGKNKNKMHLTNLATKIGFKNKVEGVDESENSKISQKGTHSTAYNQFFPKDKVKNSDKPPLPLKKPSANLIDTKISGAEKPPLQPKIGGSLSTFCTSCGSKVGKVHRFCGSCGNKVAPS